MSADLFYYDKVIEPDGSIIEIKIWVVPVSRKNPDGVKYSLYWVRDGEVLLGYDNHYPKGHHRHWGGQEESYLFTDIKSLLEDFKRDKRSLENES